MKTVNNEKQLHNKNKNKNKGEKQQKQKHKNNQNKSKNKHFVPPKLFHRNKLQVFSNAINNQISVALNGKISMANNGNVILPIVHFQKSKLIDPQTYDLYKKMFIQMGREIFGTWAPKLKLKSASDLTGGTSLATSTVGILNQVIAINVASLANISLLWGIFDEYRPVGPFSVFFFPLNTSTNRNYAVGVVDYSNNSALGSISEAISYDTAKIFDAFPYHMQNVAVQKWKGFLVGEPQLPWTSTGGDANLGYMKFMNFSSSLLWPQSSNAFGVVSWKIEIEFRQMNQGG